MATISLTVSDAQLTLIKQALADADGTNATDAQVRAWVLGQLSSQVRRHVVETTVETTKASEIATLRGQGFTV